MDKHKHHEKHHEEKHHAGAVGPHGVYAEPVTLCISCGKADYVMAFSGNYRYCYACGFLPDNNPHAPENQRPCVDAEPADAYARGVIDACNTLELFVHTSQSNMDKQLKHLRAKYRDELSGCEDEANKEHLKQFVHSIEQAAKNFGFKFVNGPGNDPVHAPTPECPSGIKVNGERRFTFCFAIADLCHVESEAEKRYKRDEDRCRRMVAG